MIIEIVSIIVIVIFTVLIRGWLDRQRGSDADHEMIPKWIAILSMGVIDGVLLNINISWMVFAFLAVYWAMYSIGWGQPLGAILTGGKGIPVYEWWQRGYLRRNPVVAMSFRGSMLGLAPLAIPDYVAAVKLGVAGAVAFPLAPIIARLFIRDANRAWAVQEYLRGAMIAVILIAAGDL